MQPGGMRERSAQPSPPGATLLTQLAVIAGLAIFFFAGLARSRRTSATAL